jgi:hypothetical protein
MVRRAAVLVLLGTLGGCFAPQSDPAAFDMLTAGRPQGVGGPLRPRGPTGYQDWANSQRGGGQPGDATALGQGTPPPGLPAWTVAGLASSAPAGALTEYTAGHPSGTAAKSPGAAVSLINSKRLQIDYEIKDVGPSGLATVELWYTHDGGPWQKYGTAPEQPPFVVDVPDEGKYGFTLLARNRAGQGKAHPEPGDPPQVAVEVDLTKPDVEVATPQFDPQAKTLTVLWQASDKNLGQQPIALCWSREPNGPWVPIITQLENTGRYVWRLPSDLPSRFWVQVEACDLAGNVATERTTDAVALGPGGAEPAVAAGDQPAAAIVTVGAREPAAPGGSDEPPPRPLTLTLEPINE